MVELAVTTKGQTVRIIRETAARILVQYPNGRRGWITPQDIVERF